MTRSYEFFKEDIEPTELDEHIWRIEQQELWRQEIMKEEAQKTVKIFIGLTKNRVRNRKFENYGTRISVRKRLPEGLPF